MPKTSSIRPVDVWLQYRLVTDGRTHDSIRRACTASLDNNARTHWQGFFGTLQRRVVYFASVTACCVELSYYPTHCFAVSRLMRLELSQQKTTMAAPRCHDTETPSARRQSRRWQATETEPASSPPAIANNVTFH